MEYCFDWLLLYIKPGKCPLVYFVTQAFSLKETLPLCHMKQPHFSHGLEEKMKSRFVIPKRRNLIILSNG